MSEMVNVLIVEDEFLTADTIKGYLEDFGYCVTGMARDAQEAIGIIELGKTDIAILDMNIQGSRDGIWLAKMINEHYRIPFIFLTAYSDSQTVKNAVDTKPYGYLVKPFNKTDIFTAIEVALQKFNQLETYQQLDFKKSLDQKKFSWGDPLFVKEKNGYRKVLLKDILYIKSELKYIEIYVKSKKYVLRYSLSDFIDLLPSDNFIQTHRSYVINKHFVEYIGPNYIMVEGNEIPFSTQRKTELLKAFNFL
jgi:two-component system, LytTR family, response regulator